MKLKINNGTEMYYIKFTLDSVFDVLQFDERGPWCGG